MMKKKNMTLMSFMFIASCSYDVIRKEYAGYNDVLALNINDRAWLPSILTVDASEIKLQYDLDTNKIWVSYRTNVREFVISAKTAKAQKIERLPSNFFEMYSHRYDVRYKLDENRLFFMKLRQVNNVTSHEYYTITEKTGIVHYFSEL